LNAIAVKIEEVNILKVRFIDMVSLWNTFLSNWFNVWCFF